MASPLLACLAAAMVAGCTHVVGGIASMPATGTPYLGGIDVDDLLLTAPELRDITGAGDDMTAVPGMDSSKPVDNENLVELAPPECQFVFRESTVFSDQVRQFHKTSFQTPPRAALLSEAAAAYSDADTARRTFNNLADSVMNCGNTVFASMYVGEWTADEHSIDTRTAGNCGRVYRVVTSVLVEVTYCGYSHVVPDLVVTRIAAKVGPK